MSRWGLKGKQSPPPAVGNRRKVYRERGQKQVGKTPLLSLLSPPPLPSLFRFNGLSLFFKRMWWFLLVLVVVFVARKIILPVAIIFPSLPDCYCHCNCARAHAFRLQDLYSRQLTEDYDAALYLISEENILVLNAWKWMKRKSGDQKKNQRVL